MDLFHLAPLALQEIRYNHSTNPCHTGKFCLRLISPVNCCILSPEIPPAVRSGDSLACKLDLTEDILVVIVNIFTSYRVSGRSGELTDIKLYSAIIKKNMTTWAYTEDVLRHIWTFMRRAERLDVMGLCIKLDVTQLQRRVVAYLALKPMALLYFTRQLGIAQYPIYFRPQTRWRFSDIDSDRSWA